MRVTERKAEEDGGVAQKEGVLDEDCWLRCHSCEKWRWVEKRCLHALTDASFFKVKDTDLDWASWLQGAGARHAAAERVWGVGGEGGARRIVFFL